MINLEKTNLQKISIYASLGVIAAGIFGMLVCFPFLYSSKIPNLLGAGLPFIAAAILIVGGLLNLSLISNNTKSPEKMTDIQRRV